MARLESEIKEIADACAKLPETEQPGFAAETFDKLLAACTLNPTGDDPAEPEPITGFVLPESMPAAVRECFEQFRKRQAMLAAARLTLEPDAKQQLGDAIGHLVDNGFVHDDLADKFRIAENRAFLDKGLHNTHSVWQMAMVANWALSPTGLARFADASWRPVFPGLDLEALVRELANRLTFRHIPTLRLYRRDAMHHYPKLGVEEFSALQGGDWQDVINLPSGRPVEQDIPFITPFIKQGDIEHSLYRHFLMPDLLQFLRDATTPRSTDFELTGKDKALLYGLPFVIQQVEAELFEQVKTTIAGQIRGWAEQLQKRKPEDAGAALAIAEKLWNYRRTPAAQECTNPVENLVKGFTATIRNAFAHLTDINFAASCGSRLDPLDVSEKFVLFASVSNGQLDNLASAHHRYLDKLANPAAWDNEAFFSHFLAVNQETDLRHIQAHFIVDKTRGCPAIPQIARFHEIVLDLVLEYVLREFGKDNVTSAGNWFLREKTPPDFP